MCGGLWFVSSVKQANCENYESVGYSNGFLNKVPDLDIYSNKLCITCYKAIQLNKIPNLAFSNGLKYPLIADKLKNLTSFEAWLVAGRHIFQSIWSVYRF